MQAYARLARLPPPQKENVDLGQLVRRVIGLETRLPGPGSAKDPKFWFRPTQPRVEQLLINILAQRRGRVAGNWRKSGPPAGEPRGDCAEVFVRDEGPGIMNPGNLFVPFFTTKPGGSGIGLTLSRQIAEAHGGTLNLANRIDRSGSEALLRLPL